MRHKNSNFKSEIEELVKENRRLTQEKDGLNQRMASLRQVNKQLGKKVDTSMNPYRQQGLVAEMEKRLEQSEKWTQELEEKLSFTVEKFEEQNQRFMECG